MNSTITRLGCAFLESNFAMFFVILRDFGTLSPSKADPGAAKVNAFRRFLVGQAMGRFFAIAKPDCKTGVHSFPCSFCGDFR